MTVILSADLTEIDDCDSTSNWASNETIVVDDESYREGSGSIAIQKVSQETSYARYDYYADHGNTYLDLTGETHIYFWTQSRQRLDTKANGGIRLRLTDASGNYREWWVGGYDDYGGGFQSYVIYTGTTPNASSGTLNLAQIRYIHFYWKVLSKNITATNDCFVDIIYYGTGITVKGGTSDNKGTFDEIISEDGIPAYGVLEKKFGVFIAKGPITFGDDTGAANSYFQDTSQIILFIDAMVSATHYEIKMVGHADKINSLELGEKVGSAGISGCIFKSSNPDLPFKITATDEDIDILGLYGCIFDSHGVIDLPTHTASREILNCSFVSGKGQIQPNTMNFVGNAIISNTDTGGAVLYESTSHRISYSNYVNNSRATEFAVAETYTLTGDQFAGNTFDIHFSAANGDLILNCAGTPRANPSEGKVLNDSSGTVTINLSVTINVDTLNLEGTPIAGVKVFVYAEAGGSYPHEEAVSINRVGQTATVTHTGHGLKTGERVWIFGADQFEYNGVLVITVIDVNSYSYTVQGSPATPATGSITSTFVILFDVTDGAGEASNSIRYLGDQPFIGRARKGSPPPPYYKTGITSGQLGNADYDTIIYLSEDQ